MKATLSVSMIVRDESAHLAGALENLREFADEVRKAKRTGRKGAKRTGIFWRYACESQRDGMQ